MMIQINPRTTISHSDEILSSSLEMVIAGASAAPSFASEQHSWNLKQLTR